MVVLVLQRDFDLFRLTWDVNLNGGRQYKALGDFCKSAFNLAADDSQVRTRFAQVLQNFNIEVFTEANHVELRGNTVKRLFQLMEGFGGLNRVIVLAVSQEHDHQRLQFLNLFFSFDQVFQKQYWLCKICAPRLTLQFTKFSQET